MNPAAAAETYRRVDRAVFPEFRRRQTEKHVAVGGFSAVHSFQ